MLNLIAISRLRRQAIKAGLSDVVAVGGNLRIAPAELPDSKQLRLKRMYPGAREFAAAKALSIPLPQGTDAELIAWVGGVLTALFAPAEPAAPAP